MLTVGNLQAENAENKTARRTAFVNLLTPALHSFSQAEDGKFNSKVRESSRALALTKPLNRPNNHAFGSGCRERWCVVV